MKKTQRKDAVRNIRKRIVSYLSVCLVIMLGLGGLFATRYMGAGLNARATDYYNEHKFKNYDMVSSLGVSEASLEKIRGIESVIDAEGVIQADGSVMFNGLKRNVTVLSLTEKVSVPEVTEGRLPRGREECMIGEDFAEVEGLKVGDKVDITLTGLSAFKNSIENNATLQDIRGDEAADNKESEKKEKESDLYEKTFTISGFMQHPDYLRRKSDNLVALPLSAFNEEVREDLYTRAFIRTEEPEDTDIFSGEYFEKTDGIRVRLEESTTMLEKEREQEVIDMANAYIDKEWEKALAELEAAENEIEDNENELNSKLNAGRNELYDAEDELDAKLAEADKKIKNGEMTIAEYEKKLKAARKDLKKKKADLKEAQEAYDSVEEFVWPLIEYAEYLMKGLEDPKLRESKKYIEKERAFAQSVIDNEETIRGIAAYAEDPDVRKKAEEYENKLGKPLFTKLLDDIGKINIDELVKESNELLEGKRDHFKDITIKRVYKIVEDFEAIRTELDKSKKKVAAAEKKIKKAEKTLSEKKAELKEGKQKRKTEEAEARRKISAGWAEYYTEKELYEGKLEEAKELLAENREEAEKKLAEAREEASKADCEFIVLDRKANAGYMDIRGNLDAIEKMGVIFGILFTVITAIVCFSTLVIIIDEQKKHVGTAKAFGFYKREILAKYLTFGVSAAILGSVLAVIGGYCLSNVIQKRYAASGMYSLGLAKSIMTIEPTLMFSAIIVIVTVLATVIACSDILRSPASVLMKGGMKRKEGGKKKAGSRKGSLYSRLIIRNMIEDKARVVVTIAIIAFSCALIGIGISMKLAFDGMMDKQVSIVNRFDIRMDMNDDVTYKDEEALKEVLTNNAASFMPATTSSTLCRWSGRLDGIHLICADPEEINEFYGVTDIETGEDLMMPDEGILIQQRMNESYGMETGDKLILLDSNLKEHEIEIKGTYRNLVGRTVVMSPKAYEAAFGEKNEINSYYIKMNGADENAVREQLLAVSDNISFETDDEFIKKYESGSKLYNVLVIMTTGIAILISFMILTNLANIYLTRKKTELSVMRVNGFSIKQAKGYLSRESIFTTAIGLALGLLFGWLVTPSLIFRMQQPDLEFVKSFHVIAWAAAVGLETLFSIVINSFVYRKVKDLNLRDIADNG